MVVAASGHRGEVMTGVDEALFLIASAVGGAWS
jgi:hypothetical protein